MFTVLRRVGAALIAGAAMAMLAACGSSTTAGVGAAAGAAGPSAVVPGSGAASGGNAPASARALASRLGCTDVSTDIPAPHPHSASAIVCLFDDQYAVVIETFATSGDMSAGITGVIEGTGITADQAVYVRGSNWFAYGVAHNADTPSATAAHLIQAKLGGTVVGG